jgi:hypothetical protein
MLMRTLWTVAPVLYLVAACASPEPQRPPAVPTSAQHGSDTTSASTRLSTPDATLAAQGILPAGYSLADTTEWSTMLEEGQRAVLRHGAVTIDTVDLAFGVAAVGEDSLVFLPVHTDTVPLLTSDTPAYESFPTDHVLWSRTSRRKLSDLLPFFDAYFSSPTITSDSKILYWGVARRDSTNALYAMRYDFQSAHLDSVFLNRQDALATDYRYHLGTPQMRGTEVSFGSVVLDTTTWRIVRPAPSSPQ